MRKMPFWTQTRFSVTWFCYPYTFAIIIPNNFFYLSDFQKLEREARICRKLQHPNIGEFFIFNK